MPIYTAMDSAQNLEKITKIEEETQRVAVSSDTQNTVFGAPEGVDALWLVQKARDLMREDSVVVHIALDDVRIQTLKSCISFFAPEIEVLVFPAWDCLPYDRVSPSKDVVAQRVATLARLVEITEETKRVPRIVLTSVNAASQKVPPRSFFDGASFSAKIGGSLDQDRLQQFLTSNGYERVQTVREHGEFAVRGGIIDLFPPENEEPIRIDLFGDEIESIRSFDPAEQTTTGKIDHFSLTPVSEFILTPEAIERFRKGYRAAFGMVRTDDMLYEAVSDGRRYNGAEHWLPLFYERLETLHDYLPKSLTVQDAHASHAYDERVTQIKDFYEARKTLVQAQQAKKPAKTKGQDVSLSGSIYNPLPWQDLYIEDLEQDVITLSPFKATEGIAFYGDAGGKGGRDFADVRALPDADVFGALKEHISQHRRGQKCVLCCYSDGSKERIKILLQNNKVRFSDVQKFTDISKGNQDISLIILPLEKGFETAELMLMTEQDLLGDRLARASKTKKRKADNFIREVSSLSEGDYVVHVDFGIGRFVGLETLEAAGVLHDCLKIVYAGDDRLFVPVENIEMLSRFGGEEAIVQLDKLGGAGWQARKARVKKNLMEMAEELLKIAAARALKKADSLHVSESVHNEFAARFPYHETEDQLRAIQDTLEDMGKTTPMDRLICGDVGFGKTEIALRAAFVASMSGEQVAIVAPTTLLARQHYQGFLKRFEGMGIRIAQLSRMVSAAEAKQVKEGLRDGSVQIVIGTHALFSKDVKFSNLGLVIVDEEQRFGVKQKEALKALKENVHVLTLTATPIPRTLQMSLTGVKEMSIIATPPVDRLAIRTFVLPYDPVVIREALLREHYRGGQSFYVCPRIKDMDALHEALKELVPEVKIVTAHGQMSPTELENRMTAFSDRQYDVLLATNIIESGIDIPNANTMVVHRSDLFGLAQLYQIRGRIGRSKARAYAYLTYEPNKKLTDTAQRRLEVLETLDTLGAGFQLASHDMDIRGAGNLLGEQQSGHIKEVGVELYQQMLEDAVAAARSGSTLGDAHEGLDNWSPNIQLGTSVLIPESYVADLNLRLSLYRRLGELENEAQIEGFAAELIDRFGSIPSEVENLLTVITIKQACKRAGISKVEAGPKGGVVTFHESFSKPAALVALLQEKPYLKLRPDQKLVRTASWTSLAERIKGVKSLISMLENL